jgi:molecular chaperone DnaJ
MKDYYKTLGVNKSAIKDEIKKAFYKLAHQHHPDKNGGNDKTFKEVNEAYQVLSDEKKRAHFDQFGSNPGASQAGGNPFGQGGFGGGFEGFDFSQFGFGGGGKGGNVHFDFGADMGDIGDLFGGMFGGSRSKSRNRKGADMQTEINITLEDVMNGVNKKINYPRNAKCNTCKGDGAKTGSKIIDCKKCNGRGKIQTARKTILGTFQQQSICDECEGEGKMPEHKCTECHGHGIIKKQENVEIPIPAGIQEDENLIMKNMGDTVKKGESGDLYISVNILDHKIFERKGLDLFTKIEVKYSDFLLGKSYFLPGLKNEKIEIKIPQFHNPKEKFILREKGLARKGYRNGNLVVDFEIKMPHSLSKSEADLLRNL